MKCKCKGECNCKRTRIRRIIIVSAVVIGTLLYYLVDNNDFDFTDATPLIDSIRDSIARIDHKVDSVRYDRDSIVYVVKNRYGKVTSVEFKDSIYHTDYDSIVDEIKHQLLDSVIV